MELQITVLADKLPILNVNVEVATSKHLLMWYDSPFVVKKANVTESEVLSATPIPKLISAVAPGVGV